MVINSSDFFGKVCTHVISFNEITSWTFVDILEDVYAIVLEPHKAQDEDELSLERKDVVTVKEQDESGWWNGELRGKEGLFPRSCVHVFQLKTNTERIFTLICND